MDFPLHFWLKFSKNVYIFVVKKYFKFHIFRSQSPAASAIPVQVEITVQDISELSVLSNSFTADLWFRCVGVRENGVRS